MGAEANIYVLRHICVGSDGDTLEIAWRSCGENYRHL